MTMQELFNVNNHVAGYDNSNGQNLDISTDSVNLVSDSVQRRPFHVDTTYKGIPEL